MAGDVRDGWPPGPPRQRPSGTTPPQVLAVLLYMALIAMSSAGPEMARNFETKQYAHNQGPATANTYDPYHHSLASDSVVWAHPVFRPLIPLVTPPVTPTPESLEYDSRLNPHLPIDTCPLVRYLYPGPSRFHPHTWHRCDDAKRTRTRYCRPIA